MPRRWTHIESASKAATSLDASLDASLDVASMRPRRGLDSLDASKPGLRPLRSENVHQNRFRLIRRTSESRPRGAGARGSQISICVTRVARES